MGSLVLTTYFSLAVKHEKYNFLANNLFINERNLSLALKENNLLFAKNKIQLLKTIKKTYYSQIVMKVIRKQIQLIRMTRLV